jgi:hypothetical protein
MTGRGGELIFDSYEEFPESRGKGQRTGAGAGTVQEWNEERGVPVQSS